MSAAADSWCVARGTDLELRLRVQPRGSRDAIEGMHGDRLRVRIGAPPVEGAANARLLEFLAVRLGVPRRRLSLARGEQSRSKDVLLAGGAAERDRCIALLR